MTTRIGIATVIIVLAGLPALAQNQAAHAAAGTKVVPAAVSEDEPIVTEPVTPGRKVALPCVIYGNCEDTGERVFVPAKMGVVDNGSALKVDNCWKENPHSSNSCIRLVQPAKGAAGLVWQNPADNWGDSPGGIDLRGAKQLSFWMRGEKGAETVEAKMGIIARNKPFGDSASAKAISVKVETAWKQFVIPLEGKDLSRIVTGFAFTVEGRAEPVTVYLDDIQFE
jgi:hypothetical protein